MFAYLCIHSSLHIHYSLFCTPLLCLLYILQLQQHILSSVIRHTSPSTAAQGLILHGGHDTERAEKEKRERTIGEEEHKWGERGRGRVRGKQREGGWYWSRSESQVTATQKQSGEKNQMLEPINSLHMFWDKSLCTWPSCEQREEEDGLRHQEDGGQKVWRSNERIKGPKQWKAKKCWE